LGMTGSLSTVRMGEVMGKAVRSFKLSLYYVVKVGKLRIRIRSTRLRTGFNTTCRSREDRHENV